VDHFDDIYFFPRGQAAIDAAVTSYRAAGLELEKIATFTTETHDFRGPREYEQTVYRVERRDEGG